MTSRQRLIETIHHREPDRPPIDLGSTSATGIACSTLAQLRDYLGLKKITVKALEPFQMLGEVDEDVREALAGDVIGLWPRGTWFGYRNENWKPFVMPDGLTVLVGGGFETTRDDDGSYLLYPQGDTSVPPSAKMPSTGYFFDLISRQGDVDEDDLDGRRDFAGQFTLIPEDELAYLEKTSIELYNNTSYGIVGQLPGMGIGSPAHVPGAAMKHTPGIRKIDEWYLAHTLYPEYIHDIFAMQTEIALQNLERYRQAVGDRIQVIWISGTDFGSQRSELMSPAMFREFYAPYYKQVNDWIHKNTPWKTFYHTCGSIVNLLDDMVEMGLDILNPVQCSATGMDPAYLKNRYKDKLVFWGGGVNTQNTLPFGAPQDVLEETKERIKIFSPGGGFVFTSIHNIQALVPMENLRAFYNAYRETYSIPTL